MISPIGSEGIEKSIKDSLISQQSKADAIRIAKIIAKAEAGEKPISETLEFMEDKISDKKRNAIIAAGSFVSAVLAYKTIGKKVVPYAKQAVKFALSLLPEQTNAKWTQRISKLINKEIKDVKFIKNFSELLGKAKINKIGDAMEWGAAGLAALYTAKGANKAGDKIDDKVDLRKMEKAEA